MKKIDLMKVHMPPREELMPELEKTLYSGMITEGVKVLEFEEALQKKFNLSIRPLSTNSCTSALQLAYRCCKVKDRIVLATPMTCTATNMPILAEGGKIVWCDIDPDTGNISVADVEKKIKQYGHSNIASISFVDFAGYPANLKKLHDISEYYNISLVEDAAQALGAKYDGEYIGEYIAWDSYVCYSFQAIKHLTTADGGALIIHEEWPEDNEWGRAKKLKWYGIDREVAKEATRWHYDIPHWGYKFHMNNVNATIGISQLNHIDSLINRHKENGKWFNSKLKDIPGIQRMKIPRKSDPSYWIYMIKVQDRENFAKAMTDAGIGVNVAHIRNDLYQCFTDYKSVINHTEERPGLEEFNDKYIAIPCGWWVTNENREYILEIIKKGW